MRTILSIVFAAACSSAMAFDVAPLNSDGPGANLPGRPVFDLLGLQPGDTIDRARQVLREHDGVDPAETGEQGTISHPNGVQLEIDIVQKLSTPRQAAGFNYLDNPNDRLSVFVASKLFDQRVLMVRRDVTYDQSANLTANQLRDQIVGKYGQPSNVEIDSYGWTSQIVYAYGPDGLVPVGDDFADATYMDGGIDKPRRTFSKSYVCEASAAVGEQMALGEISDQLSEIYDDPGCRGLLMVELSNRGGQMWHATFTVIDTPRALAHRAALVEAIDKALSTGTAAPAAQQQL